MSTIHNKIWWRNTNERNVGITDRKISWLELFYDLVYVIAISRATHHLSAHLTFEGFLDYFYMVALIYWGWLNGSWHHDILGANDVRTIFLTIWQMVILSALIVTLGTGEEMNLFNVTIAILLMQLYISYLWWSEGIYDKTNKDVRLIYVGFYMLAFALIVSTLFIDPAYLRIVFYTALIINYIPPYFVTRRASHELRYEQRLSPSMTERLGLFTIILFGEVILGVINGATAFEKLTAYEWSVFVAAIFMVFSIWYIFFKLIGDKHVKKGYVNSNLYAFLFLPIAIALGFTGVSFENVLAAGHAHHTNVNTELFLGLSIALFLISIVLLTLLVESKQVYVNAMPKMRRLLILVIAGIVVTSIISNSFSLGEFLMILLILLLILPVMILVLWNNLELKKQ